MGSSTPSTVCTPEEMFLLRGDHTCDERLARDKWGGQLLHAASLAFRHPGSGEWVSFTSEPSEPMHTALELVKQHPL